MQQQQIIWIISKCWHFFLSVLFVFVRASVYRSHLLNFVCICVFSNDLVIHFQAILSILCLEPWLVLAKKKKEKTRQADTWLLEKGSKKTRTNKYVLCMYVCNNCIYISFDSIRLRSGEYVELTLDDSF